ncbi:MAG: PAS domain S-box protein [Labilithrix sp.]|nr:PAS domain S-box protein [Labilithrix sp.]
MVRGTGAAAMRPTIGVVVWPNGSDASAPLVAAVREAGFAPRIATGLDELVDLSSRDPDGIVLICAARSLTDALVACRRIRELADGARSTICVTSSTRSGDDEADAIEAGADAVWSAAVRTSVVRAFLARAERRARSGGDVIRHRSTRRTSRVRVTSRAERQFRALFDNALDIVSVVGESGEIRVANRAVQTTLGRRPAELVGVSLWELIHPDDARLAHEMLREALADRGVASPITVRARHNDGTWVDVEITAQSLLDDPSVGGVLLHARDVTERMWVGAALQESERRFREVFENMLDGVVQIDEATQSLVQANPAFCRIVGRDRRDIFGLALLELFPKEERATIDEHLSGARRVSDGLRLRHEDGSIRYVDVGTSRMELSGARTLIAVVRDVTARRETERTRELFLAVVAHELRTPVAVLRNGVDIFKSKLATMPAADRDVLVTVFDEEVDRLTRLVGDALDVGAIQAGSLPLHRHRVALAPIVSSVAARIGLQFKATATLSLEATDGFVDPLRFEQVLANLLDNAWRHCGPATKVAVTLAVEAPFARVSVEDDGPGFPRELRDDLFERVFVPNESPTSGIGIGLWIAKRLVESMGGAIRADVSERGGGACVTFTVPLEPPPA